MRVRVGRALVRGAGLGLAAGLGYSLYQSEGDISNIGAVRSVRHSLLVLEKVPSEGS